MAFLEIFRIVVIIMLAIPFIFILLLAKFGAEDCLSNIANELPNAIEGDMNSINKAEQNYCDPSTGKFLYMQKAADLIKIIYPGWVPIAIISSLLIAAWFAKN